MKTTYASDMDTVVACAASIASAVNAATIEVESFTLATAIDFNDRLVVTYDLDGEVFLKLLLQSV